MRRVASNSCRLALLLRFAAALAPTSASADDGEVKATIAARLMDWAEAFNSRDASRACDLFSTDLISTMRGRPDEGRQAVCRRIATALANRKFSMRYAPEIKEIIVSGDLAVVRLVWRVTTRRGATSTISTEPGLDVFRYEKDGKWRITRFLAFSTSEE